MSEEEKVGFINTPDKIEAPLPIGQSGDVKSKQTDITNCGGHAIDRSMERASCENVVNHVKSAKGGNGEYIIYTFSNKYSDTVTLTLYPVSGFATVLYNKCDRGSLYAEVIASIDEVIDVINGIYKSGFYLKENPVYNGKYVLIDVNTNSIIASGIKYTSHYRAYLENNSERFRIVRSDYVLANADEKLVFVDNYARENVSDTLFAEKCAMDDQTFNDLCKVLSTGGDYLTKVDVNKELYDASVLY